MALNKCHLLPAVCNLLLLSSAPKVFILFTLKGLTRIDFPFWKKTFLRKQSCDAFEGSQGYLLYNCITFLQLRLFDSQLTLSKPSPENNKDKKPDDTGQRSFHLKVLLNYVIILSYLIENILIWAVTYVNVSLS